MDKQTPYMTSTEHPLNELEALFASCNVRFALLVVLKEEVEGLELQVQSAADSCRLGHLQLVQQGEEGKWCLQQLDDPVSKIETHKENIDTSISGYGGFLDEIVEKETVPSQGPLTIQVWSRMILVNGNHAMVDGRSLMHLVGLATQVVEPSSKWKDAIVLPDWKELVKEEVTKRRAEPPFLPGKHEGNILTIQELCKTKSSLPQSYRWDLSQTVLKALRQKIKSKAPGSTFSGFLLAILMNAVAIEYDGEKPKDIGISLLVDLRPYLTRSYNDEQLSQAHGTVTILESTTNLKGFEDEDMWNLSTNLTQQIRLRVDRGEAHRSALAVTQGEFDRAGPAATLEVSNLGVCPVPQGAQLYTAQRFDGYEGVSCMIHSEGNEDGSMRWNASVGGGLEATVVERVFTRAHEYCLQMADEPIC